MNEWQTQLPGSYPILDDKTLKRFQRIFYNLRGQGITVTYDTEYSGEQFHLWRLEKDYRPYGSNKIVGGRLYWFRQLDEWELRNFDIESASAEFFYVHS